MERLTLYIYNLNQFTDWIVYIHSSILINSFGWQNRGFSCKVSTENDPGNVQITDHIWELFGGAGWQRPKAYMGAL